MKNVIEVLERSLVNLKTEKNNILVHSARLTDEINENNLNIQAIDKKIKELNEAIDLLKGEKNENQHKKTKSKRSNTTV